MTRFLSRGIAAALLCLFGAAIAAPAALAEKHDSNTLHKIGKAIEYPIRKTSENASVDVHRAYGRKSVLHRRNGNRTYRAVVTPNGNLYRKSRVGHHRVYRRHHRHHRHYR
ncbi:MAG: hypothetical protein M3Y13_10145 [Armatimonadota bacterium]|nr:hypothetical protein [Armatimonadota bacterium]